MITRIFLAFAVLAVVGSLGACSSDTGVLESGEPRIPDDVGIVSDATLDRIQLDGERAYEIREDVESFKTRSHAITALLSWEGKYVHIGLAEDEKVRWIAGIGTVSGDPKTVFYSGVFERLGSGRRAYFEDGTVLRLAAGVDTPRKDQEVVCELDPVKDLVTKLA
ncbi:MAG: hypothetical protein WD646_03970 [Actinomycetota bacterium]